MPVDQVLPCANGLLNIKTRKLYPHNPAFFSLNVLAVEFNPDAPSPKVWEKFRNDLWPDYGNEDTALKHMFAYFLTSDMSRHKIYMMVGPPRSGKGTIGRVLEALIGPDNVVFPTVTNFSSNFGLQPLIGKQLAIIPDARFGRRDQQRVAERLLSISGEDSLTVERKYKNAWTGRLKVRFLILSNELPSIPDTAGALRSRLAIFMLTNSFFGREDLKLTDKLLKELPA